jgi:hypothetical protein
MLGSDDKESNSKYELENRRRGKPWNRGGEIWLWRVYLASSVDHGAPVAGQAVPHVQHAMHAIRADDSLQRVALAVIAGVAGRDCIEQRVQCPTGAACTGAPPLVTSH